jgi:hypothetical protein
MPWARENKNVIYALKMEPGYDPLISYDQVTSAEKHERKRYYVRLKRFPKCDARTTSDNY